VRDARSLVGWGTSNLIAPEWGGSLVSWSPGKPDPISQGALLNLEYKHSGRASGYAGGPRPPGRCP
jgi:hypothetical protein